MTEQRKIPFVGTVDTNPETKPFWDGCVAGKLVIPQCVETKKYVWYPRAISPHTRRCAAVSEPVSGPIRTRLSDKLFPSVRACCLASTSVGAMIAACSGSCGTSTTVAPAAGCCCAFWTTPLACPALGRRTMSSGAATPLLRSTVEPGAP